MPRSSRPVRRAVLVAASVLLAGALTAATTGGGDGDGGDTGPEPVAVQLLALNDFHGNLEPPTGSSGTIAGVPAGGVEYLATQLAQLAGQVQQENTITVAPGDLIGASPLLSAAFHDEPSIEALGLAGLDVASVGNHEFDEGADELLRIQNGGCHPADGCADQERPYKGAEFQYLSANAFVTDTGEPLLDPYAIKDVGGVRIGFIGMTLEGTPDIVTQSGVAGLEFRDEIETGNRYAEELQKQGVEAIVVLLHEGGTQAPNAGINDCTGLQGPIVPIAEGFSPAIDVVVSGHTHQAYNCVIAGKVVTSASSFGRLVTDIDLQIDPATGNVLTATATNVVVGRDVPADPAETELVARYRTLLGPIASRQVGETTAALTRAQEPLFGTLVGESSLGNLIADAQLAATDQEQGAVAAFMNPGGVRADLDAGPVTYEEAFTVQPFNNYLTTVDLTGAQLDCLLEQQFVAERTLQPSGSVAYTVDPNGVSGTAADPCSGTRVGALGIAGTPVDPAATYRITVNSFLADGGDGFSVLTQGTNRVVGGLDIDGLAAYLTEVGPVAPPATDRITVS
ncbi:bifunctional metallophosphatase/5'-nucleotidase [Pseudonocardia sp. CA-142604]|uniref:bifunctional metallophosphatase/5'-nucleotidase n=1 Tax=Pseudonocardia sp. CA-142604 TaxID=3240024 RepID=UPI003D8CE8C8